MLSLTVFMTVTAGSLGLLQLLSRLLQPERTRLRRRLSREFADQVDRSGPALYKDPGALVGGLGDEADAPAVPDVWDVPTQPAPTLREWADDLLHQAAVPLAAEQFALVGLAAGVALGVGGFAFGGWLGGLMGFAAGGAAPVLMLDARRRARRDRLQKQLVGAFELMSRVLRTGQSVSEALRGAVEAFEEPLAGEFAGCLHQIEMGLRQDVAFRGLVRRSSVVELRLFVTAMTVHRQTGGNLSEVLDRLAALVRARVQLKQKIRTLTAEGRLQSVTLVVLPVVTFAVMYFLNRQYAEQLLEHTRLLLITGGFMAAGVVWIRNILSFEG